MLLNFIRLRFCPFILVVFISGTLAAQTDSAQTQIIRTDSATAAMVALPSSLPVVANTPFPKPKNWSFITHVPKDCYQTFTFSITKQNWPKLAITAGITGLLVIADQKIYDGFQRFSERNNISTEESYNNLLQVKLFGKETNIIKAPRNAASLFYQLGQGATGVLIGGVLFVQGKIGHNNRSLQTASDLMEVFVSTSVISQVMKRISGRQTPGHATEAGGRWQPFPAFSDFQKRTPEFDAFPSGHLMNMMATVTVLADNYPEKKWIRPVGYALIGLTGLSMTNLGVHWMSDYPPALLFGYLNGKIVTMRHKKATEAAAHRVRF